MKRNQRAPQDRRSSPQTLANDTRIRGRHAGKNRRIWNCLDSVQGFVSQGPELSSVHTRRHSYDPRRLLVPARLSP